ncbi:hypothetical protein VTN00DRAFT_6799 [Thermoascus crustaceus]|uniref:uncharacterized protein n=1 Tax=Thermoascus crustaceus TaxID=5088 RepID=UPI0037433F97
MQSRDYCSKLIPAKVKGLEQPHSNMRIELDSDIGQAETKISNRRVDEDTRFADIEVEEGETVQWWMVCPLGWKQRQEIETSVNGRHEKAMVIRYIAKY